MERPGKHTTGNETDPVKLETLKDEYRTIIEHLDKLVEEGRLSDFDRTTLLETADDVIREIAYIFIESSCILHPRLVEKECILSKRHNI